MTAAFLSVGRGITGTWIHVDIRSASDILNSGISHGRRRCGSAIPKTGRSFDRGPALPLLCPEPGCDVELISCENRSFKQNPRFFRFKSVDRSCDHWADHDHGGGPETAQREWVKYRLATIARRLG